VARNFHDRIRRTQSSLGDELTRKDMTLDFRVFVDYEQAKHADFNRCIDLVVPSLLSTLPYFKKAGIGPEIQDKLRQAVLLAAEEAKASASPKH
jgi:hypothetical protein